MIAIKKDTCTSVDWKNNQLNFGQGKPHCDLHAGRNDFLGGGALEGDGGGAGDDDLRLGLRLGHRVHVGGDEEPPLPTVG